MTRLCLLAGRVSTALLLVFAVWTAGAMARAGESGPLDPEAVQRALSTCRSGNEPRATTTVAVVVVRHRGQRGDVAPSLKGTVTSGPVLDGGEEVATELEQVVDLAVAGEEPLRMPRRLEALHLPFSPSRRLV